MPKTRTPETGGPTVAGRFPLGVGRARGRSKFSYTPRAMTLSAIRKLITEESVESRRPVEYTRPCARFRTRIGVLAAARSPVPSAPRAPCVPRCAAPERRPLQLSLRSHCGGHSRARTGHAHPPGGARTHTELATARDAHILIQQPEIVSLARHRAAPPFSTTYTF